MAAPVTSETVSGKRTLLPGFGRPLNYIPRTTDPDYVGALLPNVLSSQNMVSRRTALPLTTLREFTMLQLMNKMTDKADWHIKVKDEEISQRWKDEALSSDWDITSKMVDWCINELRYKATLHPPSPAIPPPIVVYNGNVVKSDFAVSAELKAELQQAVRDFEAKVPERLKDWHPNSDEKVWDLVHPSLFPLVYGRTRILANGETTTLDDCILRCGDGQIAPVPPIELTEELNENVPPDPWHHDLFKNPFSAKFQWLPSEVDISGETAKITTYINNLHPHNETVLYELVSKLITASIPLWNLSLAPLRSHEGWGQRIKYDRIIYDPDPANGPPEDGPQIEPGEDSGDHYYRRKAWYAATRRVMHPEPGAFEPLPSIPRFDLKEEFRNRGLQVIVKLANIELTPYKPEYLGGSWHVEGQMNEHIVATSLYYYSCSNVTTSTLSFRQQCNPLETLEIGYLQDHHEWLSVVFGCQQEGPAVQEVGGVETREGRLLTFPNILQHRVGPFKLEDPAKPGHRQIVALFLVDPNIKVVSTAHVPCQQQDWWWEVTRSLHEKQPESIKSSIDERENVGVARLPRELQDHVLEDVDFPFCLEEAKSLRLELMDERKEFVIKHGTSFEETNVFNLCEH